MLREFQKIVRKIVKIAKMVHTKFVRESIRVI